MLITGILIITTRYGKIDMADLIRDVESNEKLYSNLDAKVHSEYGPGEVPIPSPMLLETSISDSQTVYQNGMLYYQCKNPMVRADKEKYTLETHLGFDGKITRINDQNVRANIHIGYFEDPLIFRPHTVLLSNAMVSFPLSDYLRGDDYLLHYHKDTPYRNEWILNCTVNGEENVDGLRCVKIRCDTSRIKDGKLLNRRYLWLAEDRNLLPCKSIVFFPAFSNDVPLEECYVSRFMEVDQGIWAPVESFISSFDVNSFIKSKKKILANQEHITITSISCYPNYPKSFFQNIAFPNGIVVYVAKDGKIVESYVHGLAKTKPIARRTHWVTYLVYATTALSVLSIIILIYRYIRFRLIDEKRVESRPS